jgi:hypothetical protein
MILAAVAMALGNHQIHAFHSPPTRSKTKPNTISPPNNVVPWPSFGRNDHWIGTAMIPLSTKSDDHDHPQEDSMFHRSVAGAGFVLYTIGIWIVATFLLFDLAFSHFPAHLYIRVY